MGDHNSHSCGSDNSNNRHSPQDWIYLHRKCAAHRNGKERRRNRSTKERIKLTSYLSVNFVVHAITTFPYARLNSQTPIGFKNIFWITVVKQLLNIQNCKNDNRGKNE